jgi:hypothetical protein
MKKQFWRRVLKKSNMFIKNFEESNSNIRKKKLF